MESRDKIMDESGIFGAIMAAAAVFGTAFGISAHVRQKKDTETRKLAEQYLDGIEAGTLQTDLSYVKKGVSQILIEQKDFRLEQEKTNKCFNDRLIIVETKLDDHMKVDHRKGA